MFNSYFEFKIFLIYLLIKKWFLKYFLKNKDSLLLIIFKFENETLFWKYSSNNLFILN
jgi:hypothetical protein